MFVLLCGVIPFFLSSCSDDDDNGTKTETVKQITKLDTSAMDDGGIITFNYDNKNRLSNFAGKYDNATDTEIFEYDNDGKLVKLTIKYSSENNEGEDYTEFSYSGNTIIATDYTKYDGEYNETYVYTYTLNDKGFVTKKTGKSGHYFLYTYDSNNNVTKSEYYDAETGLTETETWEYDDQNNYLSNLGLPSWYYVVYNDDKAAAGKNNAIKYTYKYKNDEPEIEVFSYTYDSDGYPTSYTVEGKTANVTYRTVNK